MKTNNKVILFVISIMILCGPKMADAKSCNEILFKDKNLHDALCNYYNWKDDFTEEEASKLSNIEELLVLENCQISDLEGLQYFKNITNIYIGGNNLENLKSLTQLNSLILLNVTNNKIKEKQFEKILNKTGKIKNLQDLRLDNNGLYNINFLDNIGNMQKYTCISMNVNKISDISSLRKCTNLDTLKISDNRITDVSPLKNLKNLTNYIDLRDNCIIDYSPIKHLFDEMYEDFDWENGMDRYDFYSNPINFKYNEKEIKFPYLTVYYKYQAYAEAVPLFKILSGSAEYDKKKGILTCKYNDNVLIFKDFSKKFTINGKEKSLNYPMRRMQYDLAYIPVKDICEVLGLEYKVIKTRKFYIGSGKSVYAPRVVKIG